MHLMVMKLNDSWSEGNAQWKQAQDLVQFPLTHLPIIPVPACLEGSLTMDLNEAGSFFQVEQMQVRAGMWFKAGTGHPKEMFRHKREYFYPVSVGLPYIIWPLIFFGFTSWFMTCSWKCTAAKDKGQAPDLEWMIRDGSVFISHCPTISEFGWRTNVIQGRLGRRCTRRIFEADFPSLHSSESHSK